MHIEPFLVPSLCWFSALASVPIIITAQSTTLLRIDWAPMKYLKLTIKSHLRRRASSNSFFWQSAPCRALLILASAVPVLPPPARSGSGPQPHIAHPCDRRLSQHGLPLDRRSAFDSAQDVTAEVVRKIGAQDAVTASPRATRRTRWCARLTSNANKCWAKCRSCRD